MLSHTQLLCKGTGLFLEGIQPLTPLPWVWPKCAGSIMHEAENLWMTGRASSSHPETRQRLVKAPPCLRCCFILCLELRSWRVRRGQSEVGLCGRAGDPPRCCVMLTYADLVTVIAQRMRSCNKLEKRCSKAPNNNERSGT